MNDAYKLVAHYNDVQVRGRQRTRKLVQRLIRQTLHVAQFVTQSEITNLSLLASASDKTEHNVFTSLQLQRSAKQCVERVTGTVVPGIHHDKPIAQSVLAAKRVPALN